MLVCLVVCLLLFLIVRLLKVRDAAKALGMDMGEVIMTREEKRVQDLEKHSPSEISNSLERSRKAQADEADESTEEEEEEEEEELEDVDELLKEDLPEMANAKADIADEFHMDDEEGSRQESSDKDVEMKELNEEDEEASNTSSGFKGLGLVSPSGSTGSFGVELISLFTSSLSS